MKKRTIIALLLTSSISSSTFAGLHALTHHSRANCINNESISWHRGHSYWLMVQSIHRLFSKEHTIVADWAYTWRSAAVHSVEGSIYSGNVWSVTGIHWYKHHEHNKPQKVAEETVTDCSIYDGWWD